MNFATFKEKLYSNKEFGDKPTNQTYLFFNINGADRGIKLTITNSIFKHSRFCKGMIVYRPSFFIRNDENFRTIVNQTNLFLNRTLKNNSDSFIIIKGSSFINMNAYSQVLSIARSSSKYNRILF